MTVGNIIGGNIFDSFVTIGIGGLISTTNMEDTLMHFDSPSMVGLTLLVLLFLRTKNGISTLEGIALVLVYVPTFS